MGLAFVAGPMVVRVALGELGTPYWAKKDLVGPMKLRVALGELGFRYWAKHSFFGQA